MVVMNGKPQGSPAKRKSAAMQKSFTTLKEGGAPVARQTTDSTKNPLQKMNLKNNDSIVSYTEQDRAELSRAHLNIDLKNINSKGEIIGKRGAKKPTKMASKQKGFAKRNSYNYEAQVKLELDDFASITELDDGASYMDDATSMLSGATYEDTLKMEHFVDDVLDQMSFTETTKVASPINTIVFEFGNVLCTQIDKLSGKSHSYLSTKDLVHKQLYFGGEERLEMLTYW
eukprot:CAMPEP_0201585764 /NCGR_PEP_ID=MMETSP0190_2-20130828/125340_1 /ASSEMBLY_ACC=CAM_ASM_000263 /TAXON_ID=37353 /ORGANISM="Rosalina sp." /LENGTH=228 /DNA_ID=CAMNT_0048032327 /DNA_START=1117 /DNA_END=1800 /DNA_ORIENTATION=+